MPLTEVVAIAFLAPLIATALSRPLPGGLTTLVPTLAWRRALAAVPAPFEYSALPWSVLPGWPLWRVPPGLSVWLGAGDPHGGRAPGP